MKKMPKGFIYKVRREGGALDTQKYRYVINGCDSNGKEILQRTLLSNLGTTAMLAPDAWEVVAYDE